MKPQTCPKYHGFIFVSFSGIFDKVFHLKVLLLLIVSCINTVSLRTRNVNRQGPVASVFQSSSFMGQIRRSVDHRNVFRRRDVSNVAAVS